MSIKKGEPILLDDLMGLDDSALPHKGWLVGIFMSPFDVHYNRAPIQGFIRKLAHRFPVKYRGRNSNMFHGQSNLFFDLRPYWQGCEYLIHNERASYVIANSRLSVYVTQIADRWARQIVTLREGVSVAPGGSFRIDSDGVASGFICPRHGGADGSPGRGTSACSRRH